MNKKRTALVTGFSSGIGYGVAQMLVRHGYTLLLISRESEGAEKVLQELRSLNEVFWYPTDLSDMQAVQHTVDVIKQEHPVIHAMFNCAGVLLFHRKETVDRLEAMFATNYLSHFILTTGLLDNLKAAHQARILTVSGEGHKGRLLEGWKDAAIHFDDLQFKHKFSVSKAAKQAVLAKILFTYELARHLKKTNVQAATFSPSLVSSGLTDELPWPVRAFVGVRTMLGQAQSPENAADHIVDLAFHHGNINGKYYLIKQQGIEEAKSSKASYDKQAAKRLWNLSEELANAILTPNI